MFDFRDCSNGNGLSRPLDHKLFSLSQRSHFSVVLALRKIVSCLTRIALSPLAGLFLAIASLMGGDPGAPV